MKHIRRPFVTVTYLFATNSARSAGLSERCHTKPNPRPRGCDIPRDYCDRANSSYFSTPCPVSWSMDTAQHERRREENCSGSLRNQIWTRACRRATSVEKYGLRWEIWASHAKVIVQMVNIIALQTCR
jgi:hypothetical protein